MNEQEAILERISNARKPVEELAEQSDEPTEAVDEQASDVTHEVTEEAAEQEPLEVVESEPEVEAPEALEEVEELYVDIDGREVSLSDIKEWEQGSLRQSDYTRKTQELAEQRKALEAKMTDMDGKTTALDDHIAELEGLAVTQQQEINWDELREYDPSEYLKQRELQDKREAAINSAKQERSSISQQKVQEKAQVELERLVTLNPQWVDNGKETEAYKTDMNRVRDYLTDLGLSDEQQQGILLSGHGQAYLDASKFHKGEKSNAVVAKKVKKAPLVTKPRGQAKPSAQTEYEAAKKAHKQVGSVDSAMRLRKATLNLKGN